ncbi:MAG: hypothetical protein HKN22_08025 [Bacteroidia bacterium]|nr:hypothetical protein [Bacteroidia bacterium]
MNTCFFLPTCSTCIRIIDHLNITNRDDIEFVDIKANGISQSQIKRMKDLAGSYEALFSRRAMKYKSMGLAEKLLSENDYRELILSEYTFLKRPVFILGDEIFIGNSKNVVAKVESRLNSSFV